MKLSYRNYPILRLFDQNCYKQVKFRCDLENLSEVSNEASRNNLLLVNQVMNITAEHGFYAKLPVYLLSSSFIKCFLENVGKFVELMKTQHSLDDFCENGCFLYGGMVVVTLKMSETLWEMFMVTSDGRILMHEIFSFDFMKDNWVVSPKMMFYDAPIENPLYEVKVMMAMLLFKKYAPIDLEFVGSRKKKISAVSGEKMVNDTGIEVTLLDSSWFRSIIRTEGFLVRGHFRLQPYKDETGEWARKLIYIHEFEKHGYCRIAKKELV